MRLSDLRPGDVVRDNAMGQEHTLLVVHTPHPLYPSLTMFVWWMDRERLWSFDALNPAMELPHTQQVRVLPERHLIDSMRAIELRRVLFPDPASRAHSRRELASLGPFVWVPIYD